MWTTTPTYWMYVEARQEKVYIFIVLWWSFCLHFSHTIVRTGHFSSTIDVSMYHINPSVEVYIRASLLLLSSFKDKIFANFCCAVVVWIHLRHQFWGGSRILRCQFCPSLRQVRTLHAFGSGLVVDTFKEQWSACNNQNCYAMLKCYCAEKFM